MTRACGSETSETTYTVANAVLTRYSTDSKEALRGRAREAAETCMGNDASGRGVSHEKDTTAIGSSVGGSGAFRKSWKSLEKNLFLLLGVRLRPS